jgi:hypothetical protein
MLGTTFVLGLASGSKTLPQVNPGGQKFAGEYFLRETLKSYRVRVRHSELVIDDQDYGRHNVEVTITTFATSTVPEYTHKAYFVIECLLSDTYVEAIDALSDWAIATSNSNITKLLGFES